MKSCPESQIVKIPGLDKIPLLKYLKEPALSKKELYDRYPQGGEYGWFAFVYSLKSFVYWDIASQDWGLLNLGSENVTQIRYMQVEQELYIMSPGETQNIRCLILDGYNRDVTHEYSQLDAERDSGDYYSDQIWNQTHGMNKGFKFSINFSDLNFRQERAGTKFALIARRSNHSIITNIQIG